MNFKPLAHPQTTNLWRWKGLLLLLIFAPTACNLPEDSVQVAAATAIANTAIAQLTQTAFGIGQGQLLTESPPLPGLTPLSSVVLISVSVETNCRSGPDKQYDRLGVLLVGETAEVVGKRTIANYWVIKNPDAPGTCWLWGMYATIEGNADLLAEMTPPPTPTSPPPTATVQLYAGFTVTFIGVCDLGGSPWANFQVSNTGTLGLESQDLHVIDTTAGTNMYGPSTSDKPFRGTADCDDTTLVESLGAGSTGYIRCHLSSNISGHNARATIELCSQNGNMGSCVEKIVTFILP